jgi:DNA-binding winged helix-turn-helix (wHTH) protein
MAASGRVELAHEPDFVIGRLTVSPSRRELVRDDGTREVIEHRVMQVLVALSKAEGNIVTRDELIMLCWDGRVVGDDSIHRVLSLLRKVASGIGAGSVEIETITKIGYRLTSRGSTTASARKHPEPEYVALSGGQSVVEPTRRNLLVGAGAIGAMAAAVGGANWYRKLSHPDVPPEIKSMMAQAKQLTSQGNREGKTRQSASIAGSSNWNPTMPMAGDGWESPTRSRRTLASEPKMSSCGYGPKPRASAPWSLSLATSTASWLLQSHYPSLATGWSGSATCGER